MAVGPAGSKTNQVFVALPDQSEVLTYDGATFATSASEPPLNVTASGSTSWTPTAVVDKNDAGGDELIVADALNNYIYVYDPSHLQGAGGTYSPYRTLGHGTGSAEGSYNDITALALHGTDGTALDTNLFIADYGNQRIQRSNDSGYSWWAVAADGSNSSGGGTGTPPGSAPSLITRPTVSGSAPVGSTLTCNPGTWDGSPTFTYQWLDDGSVVGTNATYVTQSSDIGGALTCTVTATNAAGSVGPVYATSDNIIVTGTTTPPPPPPPPGQTVGVTIDAGALYTNTTSVTVDIIPPAGTTQVILSNDGSFSSSQTFDVNASGEYSWSLASAGSERLPKTVYVRFTDSGVASYLTLSDDIILDTTAPTASAAKATAAYETVKVRTAERTAARTAKTKTVKKRDGWTLKVTARDTISGVGKLQYASSPKSKKIKTVAYAKSIHLASLASAKYVRVIDKAGNYGKWVKVKY